MKIEKPKISNNWQLVELGKVAKVFAGAGAPQSSDLFSENGVPFVRVSDLGKFKRTTDLTEIRDKLSLKALKECSLVLAKKGTVLFPKSGAAIANNNRAILGIDAYIVGHLLAVEPSEATTSHWLYWWLCQVDMMDYSDNDVYPSLKQSQVEKIKIPLPPLAEQRHIAAQLSAQMAEVERARAAVQAQLETAQKLPAALLRAVFTSHAAQQWPRRKLGEVIKVQSGYAFKSDWFVDSGIRLLRNVNVSQGCTNWDDTAYIPEHRRAEFPDFDLSEGDIILSLDRPVVSGGLKLTRLTKADLPALLLQRVGRFLLNEKIDGGFLYQFLQTGDFIGKITAHDQSLGVPHVSPKQIEQIEIPLPESLAEQRAIAARLETELAAARTLIATLETRLAEIERLPAALLRQAFNGHSA